MASSSSSLTPARKHRKLLKTAAGAEEVWSEAIEAIFVQGLKAYWHSPLANSQGSRGRSRWRNQYLVDYLQKAGIERSKKQVASHIQVLRNMWKGQPEYGLVAGGEDAGQDADGLPMKLEDHYDTTNMISMDDELDGPASPSSSSPDHRSDCLPPSPLYPSDPYSPDSTASSLSTDSPRTISSLPETPESYSLNLQPNVVHSSPLRQSHFTDLPHHAQYSKSPAPKVNPPSPLTLSTSAAPMRDNRVTAFCLRAEGMTPFQVNVEALVPPPASGAPSPTMIQTKLGVALRDDARCPQSFQGFSGTVTVANSWSDFACCITRVFVGMTCVSEESNALEVSRIEVGRVIASFPTSALAHCRWIDATLSTNIVQDIVIDNIAVFRAIYQLDRMSKSVYPSVDLLRYAHASAPAHASSSSPPPPPPPHHQETPYWKPSPQGPYSAYPTTNYGVSPLATTSSSPGSPY